jgi:uncharacterized membrane protein YdbT with pleckstrin-like domain
VPFPRKLLNDGEDIVLDLHPHWWYFIKELAGLLGLLVIGLLVALAQPSGSVAKASGGILALLIVGCLVLFGVRYAQWITTNFVVTTDRLIYRHGVLAKHGIEIPLERVNTVFFGQSLWERMLRTGDLVIESAGEGGRQAFSNVRHPSAVQNEIYKQMEDNENRKYDRIGREAREGDDTGGGSLSIPEQIRQLDELRKEGVVSEEEFKLKKQQLLDRL